MIVQYYKLDKLLKEKKITKSKFYKDLNLLPSEISKIRSHRILALDTYLKICNYLDCELSAFMEIISATSNEKEMAIDISVLTKNSYKTPLDRLP